MDTYYIKYLKYKNKYLTLQKQIGGDLDAKYNFSNCKKGKLDIKNTEKNKKDKGTYSVSPMGYNIAYGINNISVDKHNICSNICTGNKDNTEKHFFSFDDSCKNEIEQKVLSNVTENIKEIDDIKRGKQTVCVHEKITCPP